MAEKYNVLDAVVRFMGDTSDVDSSVDNVKNKINTSFADVSRQTGVAMTAVGGSITAGLGVALSKATDFQSGMAEVATLGVQDLDGLGKSVKGVAAEFGLNLTDGAKAAYQAISAGASEAETPKLLEQAAKAATAGVSDLTTAIELGTSVTNAFGMETQEAGKIYDQAFIAVKNGVTTFGELSSSVGKVAPMFQAAGLSSEEMFASITALTKGGVATSEAVTGMKAALTNIIKPSSEAAELAAELGLEFNASALESKGLAGFLEEVKEKTGGNVETMSKLFGSTEALNSVLALTGSQADSFKTTLSDMANSAGATDEAFNKMTDENVAFRWEQFKATLGVLATSIGESLLPVAQSLLEAITPIIQGISQWVMDNPTLVTGIVSVVGAIGGLLVTLGPFLILLPSLIGGISAVAGAFAFLSGPVLGVVAIVLAAVIGLFFLLKDWVTAHWEQISTILSNGWEIIKNVFQIGYTILKTVIQLILAVLEGLFGGISDTFTDITGATEEGTGGFLESFAWLQEKAIQFTDWILEKLEEFNQWIQTKLPGIVAAVRQFTNDFLKPLADLVISVGKILIWLAEAIGIINSGKDSINGAGGNPDISIPPPPDLRAKGGFASGMTIVGEEGPELLDFQGRRAFIHNNRDTQGILNQNSRATTNNISINVNGYNRDPQELSRAIRNQLHRELQLAGG